VEAYGTRCCPNVAAPPDARSIVITPHDKSIPRKATETDIGITPNGRNAVRLGMPPLTEERRKDLVKLVHAG
jgi:ribosome recycling factor